MFEIVLYEPEIPPNTGNILRLAANTGSVLHLIRPLGFSLSDRALKRSGLDYGDIENIRLHDDWASCKRHFPGRRLFAMTTRAAVNYATCRYEDRDVFVFGPETRGLPLEVLADFPPERQMRIPMMTGSRSLNLSNAVAVTLYEAWRQTGFPLGL